MDIKQQLAKEAGVSTRAEKSGRPIEIGRSNVMQNTSTSDAIRIWNLAPATITEATNLYLAKKEIKAFVKLLPM